MAALFRHFSEYLVKYMLSIYFVETGIMVQLLRHSNCKPQGSKLKIGDGDQLIHKVNLFQSAPKCYRTANCRAGVDLLHEHSFSHSSSSCALQKQTDTLLKPYTSLYLHDELKQTVKKSNLK